MKPEMRALRDFMATVRRPAPVVAPPPPPEPPKPKPEPKPPAVPKYRTDPCRSCGEEFTQVRKNGRPLQFCEGCR